MRKHKHLISASNYDALLDDVWILQMSSFMMKMYYLTLTNTKINYFQEFLIKNIWVRIERIEQI